MGGLLPGSTLDTCALKGGSKHCFLPPTGGSPSFLLKEPPFVATYPVLGVEPAWPHPLPLLETTGGRQLGNVAAEAPPLLHSEHHWICWYPIQPRWGGQDKPRGWPRVCRQGVIVVGWEPPLDYFLCEIMSLSMNSVFVECRVQPAAAAAKSLQSCPTLCDPIDGSPPGSPVPGILQARTLEWVAISFSNAWKWSHSVVSDSSRPHGLQPTRLLHPQDFPGKCTGVGSHCLLHGYSLTDHNCHMRTNKLFCFSSCEQAQRGAHVGNPPQQSGSGKAPGVEAGTGLHSFQGYGNPAGKCLTTGSPEEKTRVEEVSRDGLQPLPPTSLGPGPLT